MNFSAASSSSAVVTPGRTLDSSSLWQRTRTSPAAAILSISAGDFRTIIEGLGLDLVFESEGRDRRAQVVVDLGGVARAVEAPQGALLLVVVDERLGVLVVDAQALLHGLGLVVVALDELGAVDVADALVLRGVGLHVVDVALLLARAPARQPPDDRLVGDLDEQRGGHRALELAQRLVQRLGLLEV